MVLIQMHLKKNVTVSHVTTKAIDEHTVFHLCDVNYQSEIISFLLVSSPKENSNNSNFENTGTFIAV